MCSRQIEREQECLDRDLENGVIDSNEYNRQMRDLECDYRSAAQESATDAYEREMERW